MKFNKTVKEWEEDVQDDSDKDDTEGLVNLFRGFIKNIEETPENEEILNQIFDLLKKLR